MAATRVSQVANSGSTTFGYGLPNGVGGGATEALTLPNVMLVGASSARLVLNMGADPLTNQNYAEWRLNYRLNGGTWHAVSLHPAQYGTSGYSWSFDVALSELVTGSNTVQFSGGGFFDGYQPYIGNIDLVVG